MRTSRTYRKHTASDIIAAIEANPQWTRGGNLIAGLPEGEMAIHVTRPSDHNNYASEIVVLNGMSVQVVGKGCLDAVAALEIDDDELERLEALEEKMWDDLNS